MRYIYIPSEIKVRDFRSRLLIALKCADKGMTSIFGINTNIKKIILNSPPGIYLDKSISINKIKFLKSLKKKKNKIFCLDEESTTFFDNFEIYKNQRLNLKNIGIVNKFFCLGKKEYDYNIKLNKKYKNKFILSGNPRFDIDRYAKKIFVDEINKIKKKFNNFILVSRSFRYPYKVNKFKNLIIRAKKLNIVNNKIDLRKYIKTREERKELALEQDKLVKYIAKKNPSKQIILRPHPTEDIKKIKANFKNLKNIKVILKYEFAPWIICSDKFIHSGCSTAYTALLNNKIPISFIKKKFEKKKLIPYNLISIVNTDFKNFQKVLNHKKKNLLSTKNRKILSKFINISESSYAHEKIVNEIFDCSFDSKGMIFKKNILYEYYYLFKKLFTKFFPQDNKEKYIFKSEITKNIKNLKGAFKLKGKYKISCVGNSIYQIIKI